MPVWATIPVDQQPDIKLEQWQVRELPDGAVHLVGRCLRSREGRVSSAVVTLDAKRLVAVTETGRVYELKGHPGGCLDADYVWNHWAAVYGVTSYISHSRQIWEQSDRGKMLMKRWAAAVAKVAR